MADPREKISYGFQFLSQVEEKGPGKVAGGAGGAGVQGQQQQQQQQQQAPSPPVPRRTATEILAAKIDPRRNRPNTDKLFDVVNFLQRVPEHRPVSADELLKEIGVDLRPDGGLDTCVNELLEGHPKVRVVPDRPGWFQYQAKYEIKNRGQLLAWLTRYNQGLAEADVKDTYLGVTHDLREMVRAGEVIAVKDDGGRPVYFPRGRPFLVSLSGVGQRLRRVEGEDGSGQVSTTKDLRCEIRRGEGVRVAGEWFRVNTLESRKVQRLRAEPPLSISSGAGRRKWPPPDYTEERVGYKEPFSLQDGLPLDHAPRMRHEQQHGREEGKNEDDGQALPLVRHGCTVDVRDLLWAATRQHVPTDEKELRARLQEAALGAHHAGPRRPKMSAATLKSQANKRKKQDKEAAWRDDIRAKAAAIQAMQQQAKKKIKK
ncbi:transcription initiation factor tfiie beta subunit [Nannochloropsis oceanica]